jgi:uncharacterized repeat protein (TIGR01451 family)
MKRLMVTLLTAIMASAIFLIPTPSAKALGPIPELRYGFWPYWIGTSGYEPNWDCLTHVSYFSMDANPDGTLDTTNLGSIYGHVRDAAHSHGVKVTLTVTTHDHDKMDYDHILAYYRADLANNILQKIQTYGADGVCLDFEGVHDTNSYTGGSNRILMEQFMQILYNTLKNTDPAYHISFCVQGWTEGVYRNSNLRQYTDAVFLMGYDFHTGAYSANPDDSWAHYTGPNSPYNDPVRFDVKDSVELLDDYYPTKKIILGVPFFGWDWACTSSEPYCERLPSNGVSVTMADAIPKAGIYGRLWDSASNTPWYRYQSSGVWHQCWYEDGESIGIKNAYVRSTNLAGIGFWALGYEGNNANVWNVIGMRTGRSGGPDSFGYTYLDSNIPTGPDYDWVEISGTGTMILPSSDDQWVGGINLGFFFNYYGTDYSQLAIGNNGLLFSGVGTSQYVNQPITQTPSIHGLIAPFWDDIVTWGSAGAIYYQTLGTSPNRKFVVEWYDNQHYYSSTSGITFEAILYEGTNNILFQYKDVDFGSVYGSTSQDLPPYNNGGSATVGIEDPTGNIGLQYSFNEQVITSGLAILFKFPAFAGTNMYLSMHAPASMDRGSSMTYTLYYNDFGDVAASNVVLQATLSTNVDFVSASDGGTYDAVTRRVTWNIGTVPGFPSGRGSRTVTVIIPSSVLIGTVIQTTASITTSTLETRYDDNTASAQTTVTGSSLPPNVGVGPILGNPGGTPSVYWTTPITFTYNDPAATGVGIRIHFDSGGTDITGSMTGGPPLWSYTTTFYPRSGHATVTYTVHYPAGDSQVNFGIYVDPAGYIYDVVTLERISGASVWLQRPDGEGGWENVPIGQTPPIMQPDVNPQITGADGQYQWDVLEGTYRVHVEAPGYYPADSIVVIVPPPVTDLHVGLTPLPPPPDPVPPTTALAIGNPKYIDPSDNVYVTADTPFTLSAEDNVGGSGVSTTGYRIRNATYDSGWTASAPPIEFYLTGLADGIYLIDYNSTDNVDNIEPTQTISVTLDNSGPLITVENPPPGWALQDGVTFIALSTDLSGTRSLNFSIREANGDQGIPVGFEDMSAAYNTTTGKWELFFDTLQLPDGFYLVIVSAEDNLGHTASITVPYSIRNWAVLELLPATPNNKAGRTMPVKFALRVAASVDPNQPFVYNEELTIKIYATDNPSNILQTSTFGDTARDYRINTLSEQYITNFQTLKTPKTYVVEVWRKDMLIGSFNFQTVK